MTERTGDRCESCGAHEERTPGGSVVQPHNYGCAESRARKGAAQKPPAKKAAAKRIKRSSDG